MARSPQISERVDSKPLHSKLGEVCGTAIGRDHTDSLRASALSGRIDLSGEVSWEEVEEVLRDDSSTDGTVDGDRFLGEPSWDKPQEDVVHSKLRKLIPISFAGTGGGVFDVIDAA